MSELERTLEVERASQVQDALRAISSKMVLPLYFLFWVCDLLYMPELKWEYLALRSLVVPFHLGMSYLAPRLKSYDEIQKAALVYVGLLAAPITAMIYLSGDWASPYYAGLNLVALGSLSFLAWSWRYFLGCVVVVFAPYYLGALIIPNSWVLVDEVLVSTFFVVGTVSISAVIRLFHDQLKKQEVLSRLNLRDEIANRDRVIELKTIEAVKLAQLSSQFSPQVVEAIRSGKINMVSGVHRANICAVFIDIVNSTERVARVDKDKVNRAITMFMEDTIKTLLKYDITIDKFLGDGVLAFANDPVQYDDYVERVVKAAIEIKHRVALKQDEYIDCWMNELQLRIGIAVGFANVGFYGNERYYKSYTAIGPVINLASRLCSSAEPNQVVVSQEVAEGLETENYSIRPLGMKTLKGFESDLIKAFEISPIRASNSDIEDIDCAACTKGLLYLDSDVHGIFVMKCRSCGHVENQLLVQPNLIERKVA